MSPYVERMHKEEEELTAKIDALVEFVKNNSIFRDLPDDKADLLLAQCDCMKAYARILGIRIEMES